MIFSPNTFERYLSALRLFVQKKVLKNGNKPKYIQNLKKISFAECILGKNESFPTDVIRISDSILGAAQLLMLPRGREFKVRLSGGGIKALNSRLFICLITETVNNLKPQTLIEIDACEKIVISAVLEQKGKYIKKLIKALGGLYFYENKKGRIIITLPAKETMLPAERVENEWCYILDRFSAVNIWLLNTDWED